MRRSVTIVALILLTTGCTRDQWQRFPGPDDAIALIPWFAVMHRGLAIQPFKMPRAPVEGTVPITGTEPPLLVIPANYPALDRIPNPMPRTAESFELGKKYYEIFCVVCHGIAGAGDGPVNEKLFGIAPSLLTQQARRLQDGRIYGIIRHGRGAMPAYSEGIRREDRWHVVNYVRVLQGAAQ